MTSKSPFMQLKSFLGYSATPEGQRALSDELAALGEADNGKQENFTTGLSAAGTAAQLAQDSMPEALKAVQSALNDKGLELQFDQVLVTNVTVLRKLPTETRQIGITFNGELTAEDGATILRRAALELA